MAVPNLQIHDEGALRWDPTEVTVPSVPAIAPSDDPMSLMIAAVMPEIPTEVSEKVAATRAREGEFAAKLNAARRAYRSADDTGQQDIEAANEAIAPSGAGLGAPNAGPSGPAGQFGQPGELLGMPMQMAGGVLAAPQAAIQGVQGAADQVSQLAASMGESLGGADPDLEPRPPGLGNESDTREAPNDDARAGLSTESDSGRHTEASAERAGDGTDASPAPEPMPRDRMSSLAPRISL